MSLIITIFVLVFVTQLISWIGQGVLLELVRLHDLELDLSNPTNRYMDFTCASSTLAQTCACGS